ncbi:MAG: NADH:ubiquinone oxidoreductase subunit NDUFA12 [Alphaproteobacteria bacterium]|nr:NADH:ubiquinone oxidoreductase subunit NDUFA12 [Alphaproteobacteria bacterium]
MATLGTRLLTMFKGEFVGQDEFANRYYREKKTPAGRRERRWVLYRDDDEASSVPPTWHGWLHHIVAESPTTKPLEVKSWQKPHLPNQTGSAAAYRPPGHTLEGGERDRATGDYEPWRPE